LHVTKTRLIDTVQYWRKGILYRQLVAVYFPVPAGECPKFIE